MVDPGFYADEADLEVMLAGLRLARDIAGAGAFAGLRDKELRPGAEAHTLDEQRAYFRQETRSAQHPVGTCRIGSDNASVVDPSLRVHGLSGLRVADAAVMPSVIGANTNATVLAIAERAADLIVQ
jgi:choline dehydrogenase